MAALPLPACGREAGRGRPRDTPSLAARATAGLRAAAQGGGEGGGGAGGGLWGPRGGGGGGRGRGRGRATLGPHPGGRVLPLSWQPKARYPLAHVDLHKHILTASEHAFRNRQDSPKQTDRKSTRL